MKRLLALFLGILICVPAMMAEKGYKILNMTSKSITYQGKKCRVNDVIQNLNDIKWSSENDAMQLVNLDNKEQIIWSARKHKQNAMNRSGLKNESQLSSRALMGLPELIAELNDMVLFDEWHVYTMYPTTEEQWFELEFQLPNGSSKRIRLDGTADGDLIIRRKALPKLPMPTLQGSMYYILNGQPEILVSDNVRINVVKGVK